MIILIAIQALALLSYWPRFLTSGFDKRYLPFLEFGYDVQFIILSYTVIVPIILGFEGFQLYLISASVFFLICTAIIDLQTKFLLFENSLIILLIGGIFALHQGYYWELAGALILFSLGIYLAYQCSFSSFGGGDLLLFSALLPFLPLSLWMVFYMLSAITAGIFYLFQRKNKTPLGPSMVGGFLIVLYLNVTIPFYF